MQLEANITENTEKRSFGAPPSNGGIKLDNQDMQAARSLFVNMNRLSEPASIDFGNVHDLYSNKSLSDSTLLAQAPRTEVPSRSFVPDTKSGDDIANHAKALGERHTDWWHNEGHIYKQSVR